MPFILSREGRKCYFIYGFATHEICTFTSLDEIKGIFIPKIWISSMYSNSKERKFFSIKIYSQRKGHCFINLLLKHSEVVCSDDVCCYV